MRTIALVAALLLSAPAVWIFADPADPPGPSGDAASTSVPVGGGAEARCVEDYSPETLPHRAFAFDGTVHSIGGDPADDGQGGDSGAADDGYRPVTFDVHEWFAGGGPARVTVAMLPPTPSALDTAEYHVGSRLLVSGEPRWGGDPLDEPLAWVCGFTRTHEATTADRWREVTVDAAG